MERTAPLPEERLKRLSEDYRRARDYADLAAFPPFARFLADMEAQNERDISGVVSNPGPDEHDRLTMVRERRKIAAIARAEALKADNLRLMLSQAGVDTDLGRALD